MKPNKKKTGKPSFVEYLAVVPGFTARTTNYNSLKQLVSMRGGALYGIKENGRQILLMLK